MNYWQTTSRFISKCGPLPHMFSPKRNVINIRRKWHSVHNIMLQHLFWKHLGRNLRCVCLILTTIWQIVMPELYNRKCMLSKRLYIVHLIYRKSWWLCLSVSFLGPSFHPFPGKPLIGFISTYIISSWDSPRLMSFCAHRTLNITLILKKRRQFCRHFEMHFTKWK